jgi:hypothetical protein
MPLYYCTCLACTNKQFQVCPTKQNLLIENLEKEIIEKQKFLDTLKNKKNNDFIIKGIAYEYSM